MRKIESQSFTFEKNLGALEMKRLIIREEIFLISKKIKIKACHDE